MRYFNSSDSFQLKLATFVSPKLCAHSAHFRLVAKENGQRKETCGEVRKINGVSGWRILSSSNCQPNHAQVTGSRLYVKGEQEDGGRRERKQLKADISPATREAVGRRYRATWPRQESSTGSASAPLYFSLPPTQF